jgi:hypothetical protein
MMTQPKSLLLLFSIAVSAFGFLSVLMLAGHASPTNLAFGLRKPVVGVMFVTICFLGMAGALFPRCIERSMREKDSSTAAYSNVNLHHTVTLKGHHYDCGKFSKHTIKMKEHTLCAACTGMFLGGAFAAVVAFLYFFSDLLLINQGFVVVAFGVVAMVIGFFEAKFAGFARMTLNVLFVLGGFLILAGLDALRASLYIDLYCLVLTVFWVFTRIQLSQWDHKRECERCGVLCEITKARKDGR